jgi:hypothetical protein
MQFDLTGVWTQQLHLAGQNADRLMGLRGGSRAHLIRPVGPWQTAIERLR